MYTIRRIYQQFAARSNLSHARKPMHLLQFPGIPAFVLFLSLTLARPMLHLRFFYCIYKCPALTSFLNTPFHNISPAITPLIEVRSLMLIASISRNRFKQCRPCFLLTGLGRRPGDACASFVLISCCTFLIFTYTPLDAVIAIFYIPVHIALDITGFYFFFSVATVFDVGRACTMAA